MRKRRNRPPQNRLHTHISRLCLSGGGLGGPRLSIRSSPGSDLAPLSTLEPADSNDWALVDAPHDDGALRLYRNFSTTGHMLLLLSSSSLPPHCWSSGTRKQLGGRRWPPTRRRAQSDMGRIRSNSISSADDDGKLAADRTPAGRSLLNKRGGADCENRLTSHETKRRRRIMTAVVADSIERTAPPLDDRGERAGVGGGAGAKERLRLPPIFVVRWSYARSPPPLPLLPSVNLGRNRRTRNTLGKRRNIRRKNDDPCGPIPRPSPSNQNLAA